MSPDPERPPPGAQTRDPVSRNREPILAVLHAHLPPSGRLLELASGSGEHALAIARAFPGWSVQPSDREDAELASISAWRTVGPPNLAEPVRIDALAEDWPVPGPFDAMLAINLIHIAPWAVCVALMARAGRLLQPGGLLVTYGPYKVGGQHTAPSNETFDAWLKSRDAAFGVRDREAVVDEAAGNGLTLVEAVPMPANNFTLVFRRGP